MYPISHAIMIATTEAKQIRFSICFLHMFLRRFADATRVLWCTSKSVEMGEHGKMEPNNTHINLRPRPPSLHAFPQTLSSLDDSTVTVDEI